MNFKQNTGFLKGYLAEKNGLNLTKKFFSPININNCTNVVLKYSSKTYIHFISCKARSITFETESFDLRSTNNN